MDVSRDRQRREPERAHEVPALTRRELAGVVAGSVVAAGLAPAAIANNRRSRRMRRRQTDERQATLAAPAALIYRFALAFGTEKTRFQDLRLDKPLAIAQGRSVLHVVDTGHDRVQDRSFNGTWSGDWGREGTGNGQFIRPSAIAAGIDDSLGGIYVADTGTSRIQRFADNRRFVSAWGQPGQGPGRFDRPLGLAIQPGGEVFVSDADNHCIQKFLRDGRFLTMWGTKGDGPGEFDAPAGLAHSQPILGNNRLYVVDADNHRIQVFDPFGRFVAQWGHKGSGNGEFDDPYGVAIARDGTVYVTDSDNHRVQVFTAEGVFITAFGSNGKDPGQFDHPTGIAVDLDGRVFVVDTGNERVQRFDPV